MGVERISIEVTRRCVKGCPFCYNGSNPGGETCWTPDELVEFVGDCATNGVRAVSFGGGEPLQYDGLTDVLTRLRGVLFRSITTNGLPLDDAMLDRLAAAKPDKVHVSIHFPGHESEVRRVIRQVGDLANRGIASGVNLLVARSNLEATRHAAVMLANAGIGPERVIFLPMRGSDTPTPAELAGVVGLPRFQSASCLAACGKSPRFCSIGWDRSVAWCSYTTARRPLASLTHRALITTLDGLGLTFCGGAPDA